MGTMSKVSEKIGSEWDGDLPSFDLQGVAAKILSGSVQNVVVMAGAGISVSAGIPDFRTPGTGLYDNLAKYNLPKPTAVFDINYFRENPAPFYQLAKELFPGQHQPTPTHLFIRLLHDKGLLRRCFTQNIDSLESQAGIPTDKIVAAHGNFDTATCIDTGRAVPIAEVRDAIMRDGGWQALRERHGGLVKPDIVFLGEPLPDRFYRLAGFPLHDPEESDFAHCDLLLIMGTSLAVQPFASLIDRVAADCPRLLINREPVGRYSHAAALLGRGGGLRYGQPSNYRDAIFLGPCDAAVVQLAALLGWSEDFDALLRAHAHDPAALAAQASAAAEAAVEAAAALGAEMPAEAVAAAAPPVAAAAAGLSDEVAAVALADKVEPQEESLKTAVPLDTVGGK